MNLKQKKLTDWQRIKPASDAYRAALNEHDGCPSMAIMVATRKMREAGITLSDAEWRGVVQCARMHSGYWN